MRIGGYLGLILMIATQLLAQANVEPATRSPDDKVQQWSFAVNVTGYIIANDRAYVSPAFSGDHRHLHVEARYNYEDVETGSVWAGYNLAFGKSVTVELTPMIGGVFGNTTGVAPGYNLTVSYKKMYFLARASSLLVRIIPASTTRGRN